MRQTEDLSGRRFGNIVVIEFGYSRDRKTFWNCECDCGKRWTVRQDALLSRAKPVKSCGCKPKMGLIGRKIGRLIVIKRDIDKRKYTCLCECGNYVSVFSSNLSRDHTQSCGCYRNELIQHLGLTHGMTKTTEFNIWQSMKQRCLSKDDKRYKDYGGRGISIYPEWEKSFESFYSAVGARPTMSHTLDRYPNNDGNYEPGNVRWATKRQQAQNRRSNAYIEYKGERMTISEFGHRVGIEGTKIYHQLKTKTPEEVVRYYKKKI